MLRVLLLVAALAALVRADVAAEEDFMSDMCSASSHTLSWCTAPVTSAEYCAIADVTCDVGGQIERLNVGGFSGALPTSIGQLEKMKALFFSSDGVASTAITVMPDELADAPVLEVMTFVLGSISQPFPSFAGAFPALATLFIFAVDVTGPLPQALAESDAFKVLSVTSSDFTGPIPDFAASGNLESLVLRGTKVTGPLPVFGASNALKEYIVSDNDFITAFSDPHLLHGDDLVTFELSNNPLMTGSIPQSLGSTTTLETFIVSNMPLFTGPIPVTTQYSLGLKHLDISYINHKGPFPLQFHKLTSLETISFGQTVVGPVPNVFDQMPNLHSVGLYGFSQGDCDPADNLVGTFPQSLLGMIESPPAGAADIFLYIADTCLGGVIPELPSGEDLQPSPALLAGTIQLMYNHFSSPYPEWMIDLMTNPELNIGRDNCRFDENLFCHKPVPTDEDESQCFITLDGEFNVCGECEQPDESCEDCAGVLNGPARVDQCDVCGGDNSCLDCAGVVNGTAEYDVCDACNGDGTSCVDCDGVLNGTAELDLCGVCNGDSSECIDCFGVPHGTLEYDVCDVCGGSGSSCADCAGVIGGVKVVDECGVCTDITALDYEPACFDCAGVANGTSVRDRCLVCGGDGSTCDDPRSVLSSQMSLNQFGFLIVIPLGLTVLLVGVLIYVCYAGGDMGRPARRSSSSRRGSRVQVDRPRRRESPPVSPAPVARVPAPISLPISPAPSRPRSRPKKRQTMRK